MSDENLDSFNVVPDRPPSLDSEGYRLFVIPAQVRGFYRKWRNIVYGILIFIFMVLPWITIKGQQVILLNLPDREFRFFNFTFYAHDGPFIFFVLAGAAFSIVLITALYGRLWCGWACPQTVFIDFIYRRIEEWVEGNHIARRKLDKEAMNTKKFFKRSLKWFLYFIVSAHLAHSFTAYFVGAKELVWLSTGSPFDHWGLFLFVQVFTLILLADFGWFREQFCLIACPYGRFQSALMDQNSLAILYDYERGEPRKQKGLKDFGDCINCLRCVNVCPTGIDIRDGLQMECIACTACADACDEVMTKIKKPTGLIRYASQNEVEGKKTKTSPRVYGYLGILAMLFIGASIYIFNRPDMDIKFIRAIEAPYKQVSNKVINHFRIHLRNLSFKESQITSLQLNEPSAKIVSPQLQQSIYPGQDAWIHVFIEVPADFFTKGSKEVAWTLKFSNTSDSEGKLKLLGPGEL